MRKSLWRVSSVLATLCFASTSGLDFQTAVGDTGRVIAKEILAAKHPVDQGITFIGDSQCSNVKKLVGVFYEPVKGTVEPDLNELNLQFISSKISISYQLGEAVETIPEARDYNPNNNLILFMHGFTDHPNKTNFRSVSEAFFRQGEYNILGLDSSSLIAWFYLRASTFVKFIGQRLGEVLAALVHKGQDPQSIHLIGHSLGAHISGFAGKTFEELTGLRVGRITGLDPAGPCFASIPTELRLKESDAEFVDVIHTDAGVFGLDDNLGHVDFYPNGGSHQPGCVSQSCSHSRAVELYAESILKPDAFIGRKCKDYDQFREGKCSDDTSVMGYECPASSRGQYYLQTGEKDPYGLEKGGLRYSNNEGLVRNIGHVIKSPFTG